MTSHETSASILVTGGAGYVGSHACKALSQIGHRPVVLDNLSLGHKSSVRWGPLVVGDIADTQLVKRTIQEFNVSAVMHFAASAYVGESVINPRKYFNNNLVKTIALLDCLLDEGVEKFIFSSSCATYGVPQHLPISESHPQKPINAYGETKLAVERVLQWYGNAYKLNWVVLRYFNAAGGDPDGEIGESHEEETHLIPLVIEAALNSAKPLSIFGCHHPTPDGTPIRDYVHVSDLAAAHTLALDFLFRDNRSAAFNLGTGRGHSIREVIREVESITGLRVAVRESPARPGDPPTLVADSSLAHNQLRWTPKYSSLEQIVRTAWRWRVSRDVLAAVVP